MSANGKQPVPAHKDLPCEGKRADSVEAIKCSYLNHLKYSLAKDEFSATDHDRYYALALAIRDRLKATFAVVSVGGVMTEDDVDSRLAMGADLVMSATAAMWDPLLASRWKSRQG